MKHYDYLDPLCPECGGILTTIIGTKKIICARCNTRYRLEKENDD